MRKFIYRARARDGTTHQGAIEVESRELAVASLREQGYLVTSLRESLNRELSFFTKSGKLPAKILAVFCRQFAIELQTGLSLVASLQLLEEEASEPRLRRALSEIRLEVASGASFTRSLEKHADIFPPVFIHLIEAGEYAGALPEVLERLAIYYEKEDELRKKIFEALMYPLIITGVACVMVLILLFFVLPMLISNFAGFGIEPPRLTQVILETRDWAVQYWYVVLGVLAAAALGVRVYLKTKPGRRMADSVKLRIPIIGTLNRMVVFSRFCRSTALLLRSGISMVQSLEIVQRIVSNEIVRSALHNAILAVQRGHGLKEPLKDEKIFPSMLVQMVAVGEETGNLEQTLTQLSDYYDREVNFAVASFTKILEPLVMLILAVVVLFILISVYLPMMQMVTQI